MKIPYKQLQSALYTALGSCGYTVTASPVPNCAYPFIQIGKWRTLEDLSCKGESGARLQCTIECWDDGTVDDARIYDMAEAVTEIIKPDSEAGWRPTLANHYVAGVFCTPPEIFPDLGRESMRAMLNIEMLVFQK